MFLFHGFVQRYVIDAVILLGDDTNFHPSTNQELIFSSVETDGNSLGSSIFKNINWRDIVSDKSKFRQNLDYFDKLLEDRSILSLYFDKFKLTFPEGISSGYRLNNLLYDLLFNTLHEQFPHNTKFILLEVEIKEFIERQAEILVLDKIPPENIKIIDIII